MLSPRLFSFCNNLYKTIYFRWYHQASFEPIIHASLSIASLGQRDHSLKTIVKFKQTSRKFACVQLRPMLIANKRTRKFKRNGLKCNTSNWLFSLATRPFIAYKKGPLLATPRALTVKATDEGNHLRFPKPVLLFKQFLSRLCGYSLLIEPKSLHWVNNTWEFIHA